LNCIVPCTLIGFNRLKELILGFKKVPRVLFAV
jgi:hypothetical protein